MNSKLNSEELISGVSIQCGISRQEAETIVKAMFCKISNTLNEGEGLKIKSFGEFKCGLPSGPDNINGRISFSTGKKLDSKINKVFEYLLPARKMYDVKKLENIFYEFGIKDFKPADFPAKQSSSNIDIDSGYETVVELEKDEAPVKRLISDKLIDLHNEIVNPEKQGKHNEKKNLWG